ncbi:MAG: gliding motility-associated C-terminal domain-containing protein [Bacteroidia bacterium]|nr:gliding motility-associated C-terminal domain-containing protein [Bacteroidia bacterium]
MLQHELAPDGKIYIVHYDPYDPIPQTTLGVIHNPDAPGLACDFRPYDYSLLPGKARAGLPNNPNYNLGPLVSQPADAGPDQTLVCYGDGVTLGVPDTTGRMAFAWSPGYGLSDSTAAQPIANPEHSVTYTLTVTDTSLPAHCQGPDRDEVTVTVDCEPEIQNVLTLNHDGINETLRIRYLQPGSSFAVFDRWGHQLYATSNYNQDWPQQPDLLREGVYFWIVKAPELVGSPEGGKSYAGSVTVLR